jgi:Ca2+-binding EF-hand superfamily protein
MLFGCLALALPASTWAADEKPKKDVSAEAFGLDKVWSMHLTISAKDWKKMQPTPGKGGFMPAPPDPDAKPPEKGQDRKVRGMFGYEYEYVKGNLELDGKTYKDVGVRFKGNGTYMSSQTKLKRPFKIHLDRYVNDQNFKGLKKLTLNNNVMDTTFAREVLSYGVYRTLAVPAPRTAYAQLTLTVPGKYDKEFVGLYTLVETIDKTFLADRFGSSKGMLLKPERVGPVEYLGEEWGPYQQKYQPKTQASKKAKQRLIQFAKLVHKADDKQFAKEINNYLDVDEFLRFLAGTVILSSMDSLLGTGHNHFLFLDPKTNKFVFLPWDFDHSFGAFVFIGSAEELMDLSIRKPSANNHRLIERLFADEKTYGSYKGYLKKLLEKGFTKEEIKKDLTAINKAIDSIKKKETKAVAARKEAGGWAGAGMFNRAPGVEAFVAKRVVSVDEQLAGKRKGKVVRFAFGGPGGRPFRPAQWLVQPILDAADKDEDSKLSKEELIAGAKALFKALDKDGKGVVDQKAVTAGLDKIIPGPGGFRRPPGFPGPGTWLAKPFVDRAGKNGNVTEASLVAAAAKLFAESDKNKDGKLDEDELAEGLSKWMPMPQFGPPAGPGQFLVKPILAAADKDKDGKLSKEEAIAGGKNLFKALDKEGKGELDQKVLIAGLNKLMPRPGGFPLPGGSAGAAWAQMMIDKAGKDGKVTQASLIAAITKLFGQADKNKDGKVDEKELTEALNKLMPPPQFGPPGGRPGERAPG